MPNPPRQESVALASLDLLQQTLDYLKRLPVVPMTHDLIKRIDAHLADPSIAAAKREAEAAELAVSRRRAVRYTPGGQISYEVVVEGSKVTVRVPKNRLHPDRPDKRMKDLAAGITFEIS